MKTEKITKEILISYFKKRLEDGRDMITWSNDSYGFSDSETQDCPCVTINVATKGRTKKEFNIFSSGNSFELSEEEFNELFKIFQVKNKEKIEKHKKESEKKILNYIN